ncbi:sugar porter family MFS transporter [Corallococcus carmarthensis]|uniref:MFS transporter n=1 Tax=Corallococcus carmarthensis TaxID=2316728 RepID=A0A3A8JSR1_9BACT|nr:sugar porter family MFS transporter [Corallococcus carmarthensis]NOK23149.1 sugar porter family MFS transporter [Corallococcus carmarthensis]RKG97958.1 MFS transporter [Corallococcus carmarthensis]
MADVLDVPTSRQPPARRETRTGRVIGISVVAALGGFLFGFDTAVINGTVAALKAEFTASSLGLGMAVSSALIGSAAGAFLAGPFADRYGRRRAMMLAAALFIISSIGSGLAFSLWDLSFWRLVGGLGVGFASVVAPTYIAEIAPAYLRGRLASLQQLAIVVGIFVALLSDFAIALYAGSASNPTWLGFTAWRWMFFSGLPPALLYGIGAVFISESPRFLVAKGREEEALAVLRDIEGDSAPSKVVEIRRSLRANYTPHLADLKGGRFGFLPIVWIGIVLAMLQQFVGINVIFYYSSVLWQAVGFSEHNALAITVITSVTNILTTLVAIAFVDKVGRKPLLIVGSVGMALMLGLLAYLFGTAPLDATGKPALQGLAGTTALIAANLYVVFFGFSWGPVVWVLLGEMFPNSIRALALSIAAMAQWLANFLVSATFPALQAAGLGWAYGLYAASAVFSIFFAAKYIRETKGQELEQM